MDIAIIIPGAIGGLMGGLVAVFFVALPIALLRDWSKALRFKQKKEPAPAWKPPLPLPQQEQAINIMAPTQKMLATREHMINAYQERRAKVASVAPLLATGQYPSIGAQTTGRISLNRVRLELNKDE